LKNKMVVNIAVIGSGFGMYGLLPAFCKINDCNVVSICGQNSDRMKRYCKKYDVRHYEDWKKMIDEERLDAIAIAVVPKYQYEIAKYALEKNIGVFAEKPLTTSFETSYELNFIATEKKIPNMLDFIFPEIPEWLEAHKLIDSNFIGKILQVNINWEFLSYDLNNEINSWKTNIDDGGGAISLYFSHVLYYLENFLGRIKNLNSVFISFKKSINNGETGIRMDLLFENGCNGKIILDIAQIKQQHTLEFIGEEGSILLKNNTTSVIDGFELQVNKLGKIQKIIPKISINNKFDESEDPRIKVVLPLANRFIDWCKNGFEARPNFEEGLRVQELIIKTKEISQKEKP